MDFSAIHPLNMNCGSNNTGGGGSNNNNNRFTNRNLHQINHSQISALINPIDRLYSMQNSYFFADGLQENGQMLVAQRYQQHET